MSTVDVSVEPESLDDADGQRLIAELDADLTARYPNPEDNHLDLAPEEVGESRGVFLIARLGGVAVGCAALRDIGGGDGEIKRMYVSPTARGRGIGGLLLAELERRARSLGMRRLVLETGEKQPEALRLYERTGFAPIPRFGKYVYTTASLCLAKDLA